MNDHIHTLNNRITELEEQNYIQAQAIRDTMLILDQVLFHLQYRTDIPEDRGETRDGMSHLRKELSKYHGMVTLQRPIDLP